MTPDEEAIAWGEMPPDADLAAWIREGVNSLIAVLHAAPADVHCWSFLPAQSPLAFWARRQAHETAIHRADVQAAQAGESGTVASGAVTAVDTQFAVDGIDELLLGFLGRGRNGLRSAEPRTTAIVATDADAAWLVHLSPDGARFERGTGTVDAATAWLAGPASDLYLGLWNRRTLVDLSAAGDADLAGRWRGEMTVRWS